MYWNLQSRRWYILQKENKTDLAKEHIFLGDRVVFSKGEVIHASPTPTPCLSATWQHAAVGKGSPQVTGESL